MPTKIFIGDFYFFGNNKEEKEGLILILGYYKRSSLKTLLVAHRDRSYIQAVTHQIAIDHRFSTLPKSEVIRYINGQTKDWLWWIA